MSAPVTQWFRFNEKPVRKGYYERLWGNAVLKDYFDGDWMPAPNTTAWLIQSRPWRGLADKPLPA